MMKKALKSAAIAAIAFVVASCMIITDTGSMKASAATKWVKAYPTDHILHVKVKKKKSAKEVRIPYKAKVYVSGSIQKRTKGAWVKVKYNKRVYYKYLNPNTVYFTKKPITYSDYKNLDVSEIRQQVVTKAVDVFRTKKTVYKNTAKITPGSKDKKGRMRFDCSGFASWAVNGIMKKYVRGFEVSKGILPLYKTTDLYEDAGGKFKVRTVCKKTPDFKKMKPGDLVFFDDSNKKDGKCDHVGIYIGNKEFIHSVGSVNGVRIMPMNKGRYKARFMCAKAFLPDAVPEPIDKPYLVQSPWTTGVNVYKDIKFTKKIGDKLYTGDIVTLKYVTPCSWKNDNTTCCDIRYGNGKKGYIQSNLLEPAGDAAGGSDASGE